MVSFVTVCLFILKDKDERDKIHRKKQHDKQDGVPFGFGCYFGQGFRQKNGDPSKRIKDDDSGHVE